MLILHHLSQHLPPAHFGHIKAEKYQIWRWGAAVFSLLAQESQASFTVSHAVQVDQQLGALKSLTSKFHIVVVVFDQQNLRRPDVNDFVAHRFVLSLLEW